MLVLSSGRDFRRKSPAKGDPSAPLRMTCTAGGHSTGVSRNYAQQRSYIRRFTTIIKAIVILSAADRMGDVVEGSHGAGAAYTEGYR